MLELGVRECSSVPVILYSETRLIAAATVIISGLFNATPLPLPTPLSRALLAPHTAPLPTGHAASALSDPPGARTLRLSQDPFLIPLPRTLLSAARSAPLFRPRNNCLTASCSQKVRGFFFISLCNLHLPRTWFPRHSGWKLVLSVQQPEIGGSP